MPASAPDVFGYHEQRLNALEDDLKKVTSDQASIGTKLDNLGTQVLEIKEGLTAQVRETKEEISGKLDKLLEIGTKVSGLETKVKSLEKTRSTMKQWALKFALPAGLLLAGLLTGTEGPSIWKAILKVAGVE